MGMPFDNLIKEYYHRLQEPTQAQVFRQQLAEVTQKSPITILRYVTGITVPDALTRSVIAKELNTPISILFP
jgi:hypothetical protein